MGTELLYDVVFICSALGAVGLALGVMIFRNPIYSSFFLVGSFVPLAVIYFLLYAPFIGILQILVYAGAIMVLFTFVIMMIDMSRDEYRKQRSRPYRITALILVVVFLVISTISILIHSGNSVSQNVREQMLAAIPEKDVLGDEQLLENFGSITNIGYLIFNGDAFDRYRAQAINAEYANLKRNRVSSKQTLNVHLDILDKEKKALETTINTETNIYLLSFELVSILILVAIIGVVIIGHRRLKEDAEIQQENKPPTT
jgi:NADH-quinone oxidoreductase subunit J